MINQLLVTLINSVLGTGKKTARGNMAYHCPYCNHHKPKLVLFSNINHYHKRENYYKEQVQIMVETKEQYWNDKEFKPMKKNPLDLTKKDVLNFDPILVLDFNNNNTIIDGNHRWVVSKKLNSKIPCIYLKRKNNEHPLNSKIKSLALQLFGDKRLFKND